MSTDHVCFPFAKAQRAPCRAPQDERGPTAPGPHGFPIAWGETPTDKYRQRKGVRPGRGAGAAGGGRHALPLPRALSSEGRQEGTGSGPAALTPPPVTLLSETPLFLRGWGARKVARDFGSAGICRAATEYTTEGDGIKAHDRFLRLQTLKLQSEGKREGKGRFFLFFSFLVGTGNVPAVPGAVPARGVWPPFGRGRWAPAFSSDKASF